MSDTDEKTQGRSIWIRLWPVYVIAAGLLAAWAFGVFDYLSLDTLQAHNSTLQAFVAEHLVIAFIVYMLVYAAATAFMLPGSVFTIAGGLLFGLAGGSVATVIGATAGASILFFAARTSLGKAMNERAGKLVRRLEGGFKEDAIFYMFSLRLLPVVPFNVANVVPALLGAKYREYAFTTALGIVPGVLAYTWIGASLGATFDAGETENLFDVVKNFIPALAALGIVALLPVAYRKIAGRKAARLEEAAK
ncbi:MAG: TVP38/TMEM64 family protein [Henriciella sp.]|uniref:TVP38/TMEM64 family protein n=1 Tax=Henriciella sp. TaxID=1968823 RepID=UPI0032EF9A27